MRRRTIIVIVMIGAVAYLPWWISALIILIALWRFNSGYELLLPMILADLIYARPLTDWLNFAFPATVLVAVTIALSKILINHFFLQS